MKLSMWILEQYLIDYKPTTTIIDGAQILEGARLFDETSVPEGPYVYVSKVCDMFPESDSKEVLLMHRNDLISLRSESVEEVFNCVLAAFEFYNRWEEQLWAASRSKTPEQDLVDACIEVFEPIFIADVNLNLLAFSRHYKKGEINYYWDDFLKYDNFSLEIIRTAHDRLFGKNLPLKKYLYVHREMTAAPYSYNVMTSYLDDNGELLGQMFVSFLRPVKKSDLQLIAHLEKALNSIQHKPQIRSSNSLARGVFYDLLDEGRVNEFEMQKLLLLQGWSDLDNFCIVEVITDEQEQQDFLEAYRVNLSELIAESIFVVWGKKVIGLLCVREMEDFGEKLENIASVAGVQFGVSNYFNDINEILTYVHQAKDALNYISDSNQKVARFHDYALYAITHSKDEGYTRHSLHPLVLQLKRYDKEHNTEYAPTLRSFIQQERSYVRTAKAMLLHRNTVFYRMSKVLDMFTIDLSDVYEREYIVASFRFLD